MSPFAASLISFNIAGSPFDFRAAADKSIPNFLAAFAAPVDGEIIFMIRLFRLTMVSDELIPALVMVAMAAPSVSIDIPARAAGVATSPMPLARSS